MARGILGLCMLVVLAAPAAAAAQDYGDALRRSYVLEAAKEPAAAAAVLEAIAGAYPQDYDLFLRLGWLHFEAGDFDASLARYQEALTLNPGSVDARLGIGWCRYRQGERDRARTHFLEVLRRRPADASAQEGVALTRKMTVLGASVAVAYHVYVGHPTKASSWAIAPSLRAAISEAWLAGLTYRYLACATAGGTGAVGSWSDGGFEQHEIHAHVGWTGARVGLTAHYAYQGNDAPSLDAAHTAALVLRGRAWGDLFAVGAFSHYEDMDVWRAALRYRMPLASWLTLTPGVAYQHAGDEDLAAGSLAASIAAGRFSAEAGGRYGDEVRPAYPDQAVVYNATHRLRYGGWASLGVRLWRGLGVGAVYEYRSLRSVQGTESVDSGMHVGLLVLSWDEAVGSR
jgi:hypothetical protein